jgi:hypothetical protein
VLQWHSWVSPPTPPAGRPLPRLTGAWPWQEVRTAEYAPVSSRASVLLTASIKGSFLTKPSQPTRAYEAEGERSSPWQADPNEQSATRETFGSRRREPLRRVPKRRMSTKIY